MGSRLIKCSFLRWTVCVVVAALWWSSAAAQVGPALSGGGAAASLPYSQWSIPRATAEDPALGASGTTPVLLSSRMFSQFMPRVSNLDIGFVYSFANTLRLSRWTVDYVLPVRLGQNDVVFGEVHGESMFFGATPSAVPFIDNFWQQKPPGGHKRTDVSLGFGYRKMFGDDLFMGVNAFWDSTRLFGSWRSSGGVGVEFAANGPGDTAIDLNVNYYGNVFGDYNSRGSVFPTFNIIDAIAKGSGSFEVEGGYSCGLFDRSFDLRLKVAGYQFNVGEQHKGGYRTGADLTTRDGLLRFTADYGHDGVVGSYGSVGGYVTLGFQLENVLWGGSPFSMPEPVFQSPRNLRRLLTRPVHRLWNKPSSVVANPTCKGLPDDSQFQVPYDKACFYTGFPEAANQCHAVGRYIISDTAGGRWVNTYDKDWLVPPYDYNRDIKPMDICQSAAFARAAAGDVAIYVRCGRGPENVPDSVLWTTELPTLLSNPNVTSITAYMNCGGTWTPYQQYK